MLDEKSYENIFLYYFGYKIPYSVKPLRIIFHKKMIYLRCDGIKYLALIPSDKKDAGVLKKYEGMFNKIKHLIKTKTNN